MTEPKQAEETEKERRVEREVEIKTPLEDVRKALTDVRHAQVEAFGKKWEQRLREIFQN